MDYIKLFESFKSHDDYINWIENQGFEYKDNLGDITIKKNDSYIEFFKMKDTYHLVEFNDLDLNKVYSEIGEECYFISKIVIENENPMIIKKFLSFVNELALMDNYYTIVLVAEPFKDKKLSYDRLIKLYKNLGFSEFEEISNGSMIMYKHI